MRIKKLFCMVLACLLVVGSVSVPVDAAETEVIIPESNMMPLLVSRATGSFSMTIPARTKFSANTSFP